MKHTVRLLANFVVVASAAANATILGADAASLEQRLNVLEAQNQSLRDELVAQKELIDELKARLPESSESSRDAALDPPAASRLKFGRLHISGEGGVGYFHTGSDGQHPDDVQEIVVPEQGEVEVQFTLGVKGLPQ